VLAQDIQVVGSIQQTVDIPHPHLFRSMRSESQQVTLLQVELSEHARQKLSDRVNHSLQNEVIINSPNKTQLGMGNVPVLDQGRHGACVVFATLAAVDAVLKKGDYLSELCLLQLGRYIERNTYSPSGWEGSTGENVLNQLRMFGLVSKEQELANGCGGLTTYPMNEEGEPGTEMSPEQYHQFSEPMKMDTVGWSVILDVYQVFLDKTDMKKVLNQVKSALNGGDRVTFGILLPDVTKGVVGAVGSYHTEFDSWLLTPQIAKDIKNQNITAAHEMIITGYDDKAEAYDEEGHTYKGLFTLRNSWGTNIGDKGEFYMSYDYFKALALEAIRIRHVDD
jgi:hypothetical protein